METLLLSAATLLNLSYYIMAFVALCIIVSLGILFIEKGLKNNLERKLKDELKEDYPSELLDELDELDEFLKEGTLRKEVFRNLESLPLRARDTLVLLGVNAPKDLAKLSKKDLLNTPGCGNATVKKIIGWALQNHGVMIK